MRARAWLHPEKQQVRGALENGAGFCSGGNGKIYSRIIAQDHAEKIADGIARVRIFPPQVWQGRRRGMQRAPFGGVGFRAGYGIAPGYRDGPLRLGAKEA